MQVKQTLHSFDNSEQSFPKKVFLVQNTIIEFRIFEIVYLLNFTLNK